MQENDLANSRPDFSIVIPAYNEAKRIGQTLEKVHHFFQDKSFEVLVVDDGSTDATIAEVDKWGQRQTRVISYAPNQGKGYAVKQGVLESQGKYILITDADLSTPIEYFDLLYKEMQGSCIAIGSRGLKESQVSNQPIRVWLGKTGNRLIQFILPGIKDTQCGFKLFEAQTAKALFRRQRLSGFGFDFEILFIAQRHKKPIREIPVKWVNALGSKVKPRHYLTTLLELGAVLVNDWRGRYK